MEEWLPITVEHSSARIIPALPCQRILWEICFSVSDRTETSGRDFYQLRISSVAEDHHIAIDGTLKQNTSIVNDLSAYSYKARTRGCSEVSVLYAYDIEQMELCVPKSFPGNSIDASSYSAFIRDNDIRKGIIVADKGFPPSKIKEETGRTTGLHFLTPIKRNDLRISDNNMLSFEGVLEGIEGHVVYKKKQIKGGRFLLLLQRCLEKQPLKKPIT